EREDHVLYASHTIWESYAAFENWTKSEAFRKAHARAGDNKPTTLGHPEFEGFQAIQEVTADGTTRQMAAEEQDHPSSLPRTRHRGSRAAGEAIRDLVRRVGALASRGPGSERCSRPARSAPPGMTGACALRLGAAAGASHNRAKDRQGSRAASEQLGR